MVWFGLCTKRISLFNIGWKWERINRADVVGLDYAGLQSEADRAGLNWIRFIVNILHLSGLVRPFWGWIGPQRIRSDGIRVVWPESYE